MIPLQIINNPLVKGRGSYINTPNRFLNEVRDTSPYDGFDPRDVDIIKTQFIEVSPKTIVNKVDTEDVPYSYSLNPYQGCEHGCTYCYARNSHNYWGYSAGVDFESKILVKKNAPALLDSLLSSKKWKASPIMMSGNTDCYQPAEKEFKITRELLKVFLKHRHPVSIITKNSLILRDMDIIDELRKLDLISVALSINTIDDKIRQKLEPRASSISKRIETARELIQHKVPVTVLAAPIIPGINDQDILPLVKKLSSIGVKRINQIVVRLNGDIGEIFTDWLSKNYPDRSQKVLNKIKSMHNGQLNDSRTGQRMRGEGIIAEMIHQQFALAKKLYMIDHTNFKHNLALYKAPKTVQLSLF
jgi:DNA repair photolyase